MWDKLLKKFKFNESYLSLILGILAVLVIGILAFNYFRQQIPGTSPVETLKEEATISAEKTTAGPTEAVSLPAKHTVVAGEYLCQLAEKYYNNCNNWVNIARENNLTNPDYLETGQVLTIPKIEPNQLPATGLNGEKQAAVNEEEYTVADGDSLWDIAGKLCQDNYKWVLIAKVNNLANPDIIHKENKLKIVCQ